MMKAQIANAFIVVIAIYRMIFIPEY